MITDRDQMALDFINNLKVVTTKQINDVIYNNMRVCQRRLSTLTRSGVIYRSKNLYSKEYVYSSKPINPKQLRHKLARTEFYLELTKLANVKQFVVEPDMDNIRPDALVLCHGNKAQNGTFFALEIETSNNRVNMHKYEVFLENYYDKYFLGTKDKFFVACVTSKVIPKTSFKVIPIRPDLSNLSDVIA